MLKNGFKKFGTAVRCERSDVYGGDLDVVSNEHCNGVIVSM